MYWLFFILYHVLVVRNEEFSAYCAKYSLSLFGGY